MTSKQARRIVKRLARRGWTQVAIAERIGVSPETLRQWDKHPQRKVRGSSALLLQSLWEEVRDA